MKKGILLLIIFFIASSTTPAFFNPINSTQDKNIILNEVNPFTYCCIRHKGPYSEMENIISTLMYSMQRQNITPQGPMITIYYNNPADVLPNALEWEIGFPVTPQTFAQTPLEKKQWNYRLVAVAMHIGPYEKSNQTITEIMDWIENNNYIQDGPILGKYLNMPSSTTKPEDIRTEIWIPCEKK